MIESPISLPRTPALSSPTWRLLLVPSMVLRPLLATVCPSIFFDFLYLWWYVVSKLNPSSTLLGATPFEQGQIDQWLESVFVDLTLPASALVLPVLDKAPHNPEVGFHLLCCISFG